MGGRHLRSGCPLPARGGRHRRRRAGHDRLGGRIGGPLWRADITAVGGRLIDHAGAWWRHDGAVGGWLLGRLAASEAQQEAGGDRHGRQAEIRPVSPQVSLWLHRMRGAVADRGGRLSIGYCPRHGGISAGKRGWETFKPGGQ